MTCDDVRLDLSAQLDGELTGPAPDRLAAQLAAHLAECAGCREWQAQAARLAGLVGPAAVEVPDLTGRIMAAVARDRAARQTAPPVPARPVPAPTDRYAAEALARQRILRLAVAAAAAVQLALALPALISAFVGPGVGIGLHASREMASFDVAVAIGFLLAAARPDRARAFLPVAVVLAGCLAATSGIDIVRGATVVSHEIGHLVALAQAGLLWALSRSRPPLPGSGLPGAGLPGSGLPSSGQGGERGAGPVAA